MPPEKSVGWQKVPDIKIIHQNLEFGAVLKNGLMKTLRKKQF